MAKLTLHGRWRAQSIVFGSILGLCFFGSAASALETVNMALSNKNFQMIPVQRAYDFRFAREADRQLTQSGWRP